MAASDLRNFAKRMRRRAESFDRVGNEANIRAALAVLGYLIRETPVDTSQALSNWQVSIGSMSIQFPLPPYYPGQRGSTLTSSSREAYANGAALIKAKKPGQTVYISNVLPYIVQLNEGSSTQAPRGMTYGVRAIALNALKGRK